MSRTRPTDAEAQALLHDCGWCGATTGAWCGIWIRNVWSAACWQWVGYLHQRRLEIPAPPEEEWFCQECRKGRHPQTQDVLCPCCRALA